MIYLQREKQEPRVKTRAVFDRYDIANEEDLEAACERLSNAHEQMKAVTNTVTIPPRR